MITFKDASQRELHEIINKVVNLRLDTGQLLMKKYDIQWLIQEFEGEKIDFLEKKFYPFSQQGVDVIDFCTIFLQLILHQEYETIYILIGLVDIFRSITESNNMANKVTLQQITALFADVILQKEDVF